MVAQPGELNASNEYSLRGNTSIPGRRLIYAQNTTSAQLPRSALQQQLQEEALRRASLGSIGTRYASNDYEEVLPPLNEYLSKRDRIALKKHGTPLNRLSMPAGHEIAIQNNRTPQTRKVGATASSFWKPKTSYFTRGFHNIMFRDHTIAAATKEKERRIVSLQRMREREETKRKQQEERARKRELTMYYRSFGIGCGDKEVEGLTEY